MTLLLLLLTAVSPFEDLTPDARKDYARLERRLEADMHRSGRDETIAASANLLTAMRLSTRGADKHVYGGAPLYGRYREYGRTDVYEIKSDGSVHFAEWGQITMTGSGRGWIEGRLPNGNLVLIRALDNGAVLMVADRLGDPVRSGWLVRQD
jgi:hypothetical protein